MHRVLRALLSASLVVATIVAASGSGELFLEDAGGRRLGPLRGGEEITIDGSSYRVVAAPDSDNELECRLQRIRIPMLEFFEASLYDALEFLRLTAAELDPENSDIRIDFDERLWIAAEEGPHWLYKRVLPAIAEIPVTLKLTDIPLHDALRYTTEVAGLTIRLQDGRVVVCPAEGMEPRSSLERWLDPGQRHGVRDSDEARALLERLETAEVPRLEFTDAYIGDALRFLQLSASEIGVEDMNLVFVSRFPLESSDWRDRAKVESSIAHVETPEITMNLRDVPLLDAIRYVADYCDLIVLVDDHAVVVYPERVGRTELTRTPWGARGLRAAFRLVADAAVLAELDQYNSTIRQEGSGSDVTSGEPARRACFLYLGDFGVELGQAYLPEHDPLGRLMSFDYGLQGRTDAPPRMRQFTVKISAAFAGPGRAAASE